MSCAPYVSAEYREKLSLDRKISSAKIVLNQLMRDIKIDKRKIAVFGIMEGFHVVAKLATVEKTVTHLFLFVWSGFNQFYDCIINDRIDEQRGVLTHEKAQRNIDSFMIISKTIFTSPEATDREWYGHTYLK